MLILVIRVDSSSSMKKQGATYIETSYFDHYFQQEYRIRKAYFYGLFGIVGSLFIFSKPFSLLHLLSSPLDFLQSLQNLVLSNKILEIQNLEINIEIGLYVYSYVMSQQYLYAQQSNELLQLQQDVTQLQSFFIRWKQCLLHLPSVNESQKMEIGQQIVMKLNSIFQAVGQFCFKFEKQMFSLQNKLQSILLKVNTPFQVNNKFQHSQFGLVMRKVQSLEKQLRQTTQRSNKIQEALSVIISKPILQQNSKNQLKHIKSSHQLNMAYGEQSFIYNLPLQCSSKSSRTKCGGQKRQTPRQNQSNIYLSSVQSNHFDQSLRSNTLIGQRDEKSQFIRTLSIENQHKYSLKQMPILSKQQNFNTTINFSESLAFRKHSSRVKNEHRLNFLMKNLQQ